ncbi:hypothetical protein [Bradyrhizobium sp. Ash2021]|uniref:hypothetical protein n=1 Tax=Bradyrhizobium sp. Ash2021 TaxID=2954771 RepID=UPI002815171E|nr:hypothetical protein [Bradyrhizobium sp. Ash2021]WMT74137.1 hypothetical protein NL528_40610 [Bradyrhizobium sp. Ash2021]
MTVKLEDNSHRTVAAVRDGVNPRDGTEDHAEFITIAWDDFSSKRHPALSFCLSMIFSQKPVPALR